MTEQLERILLTSEYIKGKFPKKFKPEIAVISEKNFGLEKEFSIISEVGFWNLPFEFENKSECKSKILFARSGGRDIILISRRFHYYDGVSMRNIGHLIYTMRYLGIKKIISIDEAGVLNPRYGCGEIALIYDHINLMGDNPLIGKNDNELGLRFPDMSNAYNKKLFSTVYNVFQEKMIRMNESVYVGITGPESETDAEARFYRDIGGDVLGYSIVPENITAVHAGLDFIGIGLMTRDLVADRMMEDTRSEKEKEQDRDVCRKSALKILKKVLGTLIKEI